MVQGCLRQTGCGGSIEGLPAAGLLLVDGAGLPAAGLRDWMTQGCLRQQA